MKRSTSSTLHSLVLVCVFPFTSVALTAHAAPTDVVVKSIVFNDLPASGGDFPSPAKQVAYVTLENRSDSWAGSGTPCNLSTGEDCLRHGLDLFLDGASAHADTNTIPPRGTSLVSFSYPAGTLKHCQLANMRIYGIYDNVVLWANTSAKVRIYANGAVPLCDFRPGPFPPRRFPVPAITQLPH